MGNPTQTLSWKRLLQSSKTAAPQINANSSRIISLNGFQLDFSKHRITDKILDDLIALAKEQNLEEMREKFFAGDKINASENRAVLHTACRAENPIIETEIAQKAVDFSKSVLKRMKNFSKSVRDGQHKGFSGKVITDVVNIGIGGSDLGPRMIVQSLAHLSDKVKCHFVSNVDAMDIQQTLDNLNPETTLFLIASKTFTTQETLTNAQTAKSWFLEKGQEKDIAKHFVALSTNLDATQSFGISNDMVFPFEEWVGGRFSLWASIGLSIMLSIGSDNFQKLLDGAHEMDRHFYATSFDKNIPVLMALLGVWERNFMGSHSLAVLPYTEKLSLLPAYLQQLDMESNGKSKDREGNDIDYKTAPVIFGQAGTNGQHAFYQALHQGSDTIPSDFIIIKNMPSQINDHQNKLLANAIAQIEALAFGNGSDFKGNKPLSLIMLDELNPYFLGMLIAAYEHKIFVQGVLWNLNSFDQPGVELGKKLAKGILEDSNCAGAYAFLFKK